MSKGQVLTWTTYDTLLLALLMDKRVDEAESVWNTVIQTHTRSVPKRLFSRMILIYDIHQRPDKVLEVYLTHLHLLVGLDMCPCIATRVKISKTLITARR
jgi:hypothetical protein